MYLWLSIRYLSNILGRLGILSWNFWGYYYHYFCSYNLNKLKECNFIQVVKEHRQNLLGIILSLIFQVNFRSYKSKLKIILFVSGLKTVEKVSPIYKQQTLLWIFIEKKTEKIYNIFSMKKTVIKKRTEISLKSFFPQDKFSKEK